VLEKIRKNPLIVVLLISLLSIPLFLSFKSSDTSKPSESLSLEEIRKELRVFLDSFLKGSGTSAYSRIAFEDGGFSFENEDTKPQGSEGEGEPLGESRPTDAWRMLSAAITYLQTNDKNYLELALKFNDKFTNPAAWNSVSFAAATTSRLLDNPSFLTVPMINASHINQEAESANDKEAYKKKFTEKIEVMSVAAYARLFIELYKAIQLPNNQKFLIENGYLAKDTPFEKQYYAEQYLSLANFYTDIAVESSKNSLKTSSNSSSFREDTCWALWAASGLQKISPDKERLKFLQEIIVKSRLWKSNPQENPVPNTQAAIACAIAMNDLAPIGLEFEESRRTFVRDFIDPLRQGALGQRVCSNRDGGFFNMKVYSAEQCNTMPKLLSDNAFAQLLFQELKNEDL
jgi:hypothetical protein